MGWDKGATTVLMCVLLTLGGCKDDPGRDEISDGATTDATPEPAGTCLPGASAADCALCKYGVESCTQACPKIDCPAFPTPAACAGFCAGEPCCECRLFVGNEYWWRQPERRMCTSACMDMERRYAELVSAPVATACETSADCLLLFPFQRCDGSEGLGGITNRPVNAKYYESSGAKALEAMYRSTCKLQSFADGGPAALLCTNKTCTAKPERGCL